MSRVAARTPIIGAGLYRLPIVGDDLGFQVPDPDNVLLRPLPRDDVARAAMLLNVAVVDVLGNVLGGRDEAAVCFLKRQGALAITAECEALFTF